MRSPLNPNPRKFEPAASPLSKVLLGSLSVLMLFGPAQATTLNFDTP